MPDFTITNAVVEFSMIDPASPDFKPVGSKVTLSFAVAEGADGAAVVAKVHDIAKQQVRAALGLSHTRGLPPVLAEPIQILPDDGPPARRRKTVAEVKVAASPEAQSEENPLAGLASLQDDAPAQEPVSDEAEGSAEDELASLAGPVEITLDDVKNQCQKTAAHLQKKVGNVNDIRKLLASYNVPGYGSVPVEKRAEFVEKLKALAS